MRVCLIATEIFAWGKHGGFGRAARLIGRELVRRGVDVSAVVPRRPGQGERERLDGIEVLGFPGHAPWRSAALCRRADADVYHSCEVSLASAFALDAMPGRRHVATFRDPRDAHDWLLELARPSRSRLQVAANFVYEGWPWLRGAVRRMDAHFVIGRWLAPKVRTLYDLPRTPAFLPTPVAVPARVTKAAQPTVLWMARLDRRKRPELFLRLAPRFPGVRFVVAGKSRDARWEAALRERWGRLPNVEFVGFVDQFDDPRHGRLLGEAWVLVNCATREALPNSFIEGAAHRCALLSHVDPDAMASRFGYHAASGDFERGLARLLDGDRWRALGEAAARWTDETFGLERAIGLHLDAYRGLLSADGAARAPGPGRRAAGRRRG